MSDPTRRTWAEIDLDALAGNLRALRALLSPSCRVMAVVKADAYGHGLVPVSRAGLESGAQWLGVATLDEGMALRTAGVVAPVLVFGALDAEGLAEALTHRLSVTITSPEALEVLTDRTGSPAGIHLKVDTGMTRLGIRPEDVPGVFSKVTALEGCYTHLAYADDTDLAFTDAQLNKFEPIVDEVRRRFPHVIIHAASSAAAIAYPESHYDLVRIGISMYGIYPAPHLQNRVTLRPAMRFLSRVVRVVRVPAGTPVSYGGTYRTARSTVIATVACGYADGYPRQAGGRSQVAIKGRRHPVVGRVNMDHVMVDVGDADVQVGDEVELFGTAVSVDEVAEWADSVSYQVLCAIGPRVPRVFVRGGQMVEVRGPR